MPLARCAVPFFYLVSVFLAKKTYSMDMAPFLSLSKKWILMWSKYFILFAIIGVLIDWYSGDVMYPSLCDIKSLMLSGQCLYVNEHLVNAHKMGLLTLWFLYEGAMAFGLLFLLRKHLHSKFLLFIIILSQLASAILIHKGICKWLFLYSSFPFLYYGMWFGRTDLPSNIGKKIFLIMAACGSFLLSIIEYKILGDVVFVNLFFSIILFILIASPETEKTSYRLMPPILLRKFRKSSPITLDIYIWHRFVYVLIVLLGIDCHGIDAIVIFTITLLVSWVIRYYLKNGFPQTSKLT